MPQAGYSSEFPSSQVQANRAQPTPEIQSVVELRERAGKICREIRDATDILRHYADGMYGARPTPPNELTPVVDSVRDGIIEAQRLMDDLANQISRICGRDG